MAFEKIVAPTPKELFLSQVIRMILSGELKPGEQLPTERRLSELMAVNRSIVHSGIEELQRMGFVTMEPRKGNYVADYRHEGNFNTLSAIARYGEGDFDTNMRISLVELRNAIVGGAMIRLAKCGTQEDMRQLRALSARHKKEAAAHHDLATATRHLMEFNIALAQHSGNSMFVLLMNTFAQSSLPIWERCIRHWGLDSPVKQEEIILDLLERGNGHEAAVYLENMFETYMQDTGLHR